MGKRTSPTAAGPRDDATGPNVMVPRQKGLTRSPLRPRRLYWLTPRARGSVVVIALPPSTTRCLGSLADGSTPRRRVDEAPFSAYAS